MKIVFISHPYKDDPIGNIELVRLICEELKSEVITIAPHLMLPQYIDEHTERDIAMQHCKGLIGVCDELWICSSNFTSGVIEEAHYARENGITVFNMSARFEK